MAEQVLRMVTLSAGGRPRPAFDFDRGEGYMSARGTFAIEPGERAVQQVRQGGRYGGSRAVGETVENATIKGSFYVEGESADEALSRLKAILLEAETPGPGRYIEWKAPGATHSIFFERRGPISYVPNYRQGWFRSRPTMGFELEIPVSPLGHGLPLDIFDAFDEDSIEDYAFDAGSGLSISGGNLVPASDALKRIWHSARGYNYSDAEVTLQFTTGASGAGDNGPVLRRLNSQDCLCALLRADKLAICKLDAGVLTELASVAVTPAANRTYWVRFRATGNALTADLFDDVGLTGDPLPLTSADATATHTLAGANLTKFGAGSEGDVGAYIDPPATDWLYRSFRAEPFSYRVNTPAKVALGGEIPGDADALLDVEITASGDPYPRWGLFAWGDPGSDAPFGQITPNGSGDFIIDPGSLSEPDQFNPHEVAIEVWGRFAIPTNAVSPRATLHAEAEAQSSITSKRYTSEFGAGGRPLVLPLSGTNRLSRLGTLILPVEEDSPLWQLVVTLSVAPGSPAVTLSSLFCVPAHARSVGPTGKPRDINYPELFHSTDPQTKRIDSQGRGRIKTAAGVYGDHGLGGSLPRLSPGQQSFFLALTTHVPDDPVPASAHDDNTHSVALHLSVVPRYVFAR